MQSEFTNDPAALRREAESRLRARPATTPPQSEAELHRLWHELEVRQIELEIQIEQLREAKEKAETVLSESQSIAQIGSWEWGLAGPIKWTPETFKIYGVTPETFTPTVESLIHLIHPEDRPALQRWIEDCAAGRAANELEFRSIRADGSVRTLCGRGELKHDGAGNCSYIAGTVQDITE